MQQNAVSSTANRSRCRVPTTAQLLITARVLLVVADAACDEFAKLGAALLGEQKYWAGKRPVNPHTHWHIAALSIDCEPSYRVPPGLSGDQYFSSEFRAGVRTEPLHASEPALQGSRKAARCS